MFANAPRVYLGRVRVYLGRVCLCNLYASFCASRHQNPLTSKAVNSTQGMATNMAPPKEWMSSYVSHSAAVRDCLGVPHIELIESTSRIMLNAKRIAISCRATPSIPDENENLGLNPIFENLP